MSNYRPYRSKDGNKHSDFWEAYSADRRYDQQQNIYNELKRQNDLLERSNTNTNNTGEELITVL